MSRPSTERRKSDGATYPEWRDAVSRCHHFADYFDLYQPELNAIHRLLHDMKGKIAAIDSSVAAFNLGVNAGAEAGQTIFHCHVHLSRAAGVLWRIRVAVFAG
jgi:hypothetical protein